MLRTFHHRLSLAEAATQQRDGTKARNLIFLTCCAHERSKIIEKVDVKFHPFNSQVWVG